MESESTPLGAGATIHDALAAIDRSGEGIALVVDGRGYLLGLVTDGDIRRALLNGASLIDPVLAFACTRPTTVSSSASRAVVLDLMLARSLDHVPIVDAEGRLVGLHTLRRLMGRASKSNRVLILAGGRGSRLGAQTDDVPKPLLKVAGRPILERLVDHFVGFGFGDITISIAYRGDRIREHFGSGDGLGCSISYLEEDPRHPRGTGGPLGDFVRSRGDIEEPIIVANGDLVTDIDLGSLLNDHEGAEADVTIAVHRYVHEFAFGIVDVDENGRVVRVEEKPTLVTPISAGIYVVDPSVAMSVPPKGTVPMTELLDLCIKQGKRVHASYGEAQWIDVGTPTELGRARQGY